MQIDTARHDLLARVRDARVRPLALVGWDWPRCWAGGIGVPCELSDGVC
jgi:hypothetical protein